MTNHRSRFRLATGLLGWTLTGSTKLGSNALLLPGASALENVPAIPDATGFTESLPAGTDTFWMLDGDQPASYYFDLGRLFP